MKATAIGCGLGLLLLLLPVGGQAQALEGLSSPAPPGSLAPGLAPSRHGPVLTWLETTATGHALRFAVFDGRTFGTPRTIAQGDDWFANWADTPALFELPGGDWVAHWLEKSGPGTYAYDVRVTRSRDRGLSWSPPITPHDDGTPTEHGFVSYYAVDEHRVGLFWLDGRHTAGSHAGHHQHHGDMTLRSAHLARSGALSAAHELDTRVCDCCQTAAAMTDNGPVVVYRGRSEDELRDILLARQVGGEWQAPVTVHDDGWRIAACPVNGPQIVARGMQVVVAWFTMADNRPRVMLARSADGGASFATPVEVAAGAVQGRVALLGRDDGELLLAWLDDGMLWLARFDQHLRESGRQPLTVMDGGRISGFPQLAIIDGQLLVAWTTSVDGQPRVMVGRLWLQSDHQTSHLLPPPVPVIRR